MNDVSVLLGRISDCKFVQGLPDQVKYLLHVLTKMDKLSTDQLLVRAWTIMKDKVTEESGSSGGMNNIEWNEEDSYSGSMWLHIMPFL